MIPFKLYEPISYIWEYKWADEFLPVSYLMNDLLEKLFQFAKFKTFKTLNYYAIHDL